MTVRLEDELCSPDQPATTQARRGDVGINPLRQKLRPRLHCPIRWERRAALPNLF